jgi:hypothetical protein
MPKNTVQIWALDDTLRVVGYSSMNMRHPENCCA